MTRYYVVEGQTEPVAVQLLRDGHAVDLTGLPVTLVLRGTDGSLVDTSDDVDVLDAATGTVRYNPPADAFDIAKSPYVARWRVVDGAGKIGFWPNRSADLWFVGR